MAIQILPGMSAGTSLGSALGQGISGALQGLAQQKLQRMLRGQQAPGLESLGFAPQQAQALSGLDPQALREVIKQRLQAPQQQQFAQALSGLLGGEQMPGQPPAEGTEAQMLGTFGAPQVSPSEDGVLPGIPTSLKPQQAIQLAELGLKKQQMGEREKAAKFKETKAERKEIIDKARAARLNITDLDRMEELLTEGKLDTPGFIEFSKRSGFDIPALMNPDSQEFQKIAANFIRDAKLYYGGRVTNQEMEQFLKTIPSLSQSPEGMKRVISNLKRVNRVALEYNNALKEVMSENKGVPPFDLMEKVDDKIEKKLDKISKQFKEDLTKPVPEGQRSWVTTLQAIGGMAASALPPILKEGVKGLAKGAGQTIGLSALG